MRNTEGIADSSSGVKVVAEVRTMRFDRLVVGCGYLGLRTAKRWLEAGMSVAATTRSKERAEEFSAIGIQPIVADVTNPTSLEGLPQADSVLHCVGFDRSAAPNKREVYVAGLANVLSAVAGKSSRLIHISSTSVYGQHNGESVNESSVCEPNSEGGQICLEAENLVRDSELEWNILRLAGIYGPGRLLRRVEQIKSGEPIAGRPDAFLNLIHVEDAVSVVDACFSEWTSGRLLLVADGNTTTRRQYFGALAEHLSGPEPTFDPTEVSRHTAGINKKCDTTLLRDTLRVPLEFGNLADGIQDSLPAATNRSAISADPSK